MTPDRRRTTLFAFPMPSLVLCTAVMFLVGLGFAAPKKKAETTATKRSRVTATTSKGNSTTSSLSSDRATGRSTVAPPQAKSNARAKRDVGTPGHFLLAEVKGKELRQDEFTTYSDFVATYEGGLLSEKRSRDLLREFVMQQVICDVLTTLPKEVVEGPNLPIPYKSPLELAALKRRLREKIERETSPTREQLEKWREENAKRFMRPEQIHAYHLFMQTSKDVPTSSVETVRQRMQEVRNMAERGTSFSELARRYSEAASGRVGGDIGWVGRRMPIGPEAKPMNIVLENALFALQPGQVSEIVQTSHGLHLLYCADRVTTYIPTTDDLISSGILPRSAVAQLARDRWREGLRNIRQKYEAKVLFDVEKRDTLSSDVPAVRFANQVWTLRQFEQLYGSRFTTAYRLRSKQTTQSLLALFEELLDELAALQWALDEKVNADPTVQQELTWASDRGRMKRALAYYIADNFPLTEEGMRKAYEQRKYLMRQPEGRGYILSVKAEPTTVGMTRDEARQRAKQRAEEIRKKILAGADIEKLAREVSQDNRASSGGLVERSVLSQLSDPAGRMFGAVAGWLKAGEVSEVRQFGDWFVVVKLVERWEGEIPPYEEVRSRLENVLRSEIDEAARYTILQLARDKGLVVWFNPSAQYGINPDRGW